LDVDVVFAGHIDHGKSTLIGRLLYDSENIQDDRITEIQKLAQEFKKKFEFAYFLDSFEDEMKEERTIDTTVAMFKGKNDYSVTDVPGHKEFIKNMLTGSSHADIAVLVVSAIDGIEEQTRRHAFLLKMIGIMDIFVVINKMDAVKYNIDEFEKVKEDVEALLKSFNYSGMNIIPISAIEGENVFKRSLLMDWYKGPTLIEALDNLKLHRTEKVSRFVVQDIYQIGSEKIVVGRVESGVIRKGDKIRVEPSGINGIVEKILIYNRELIEARKGQSIGLIVNCDLRRGEVCGSINNPPVSVNKFIGETVIVDEKISKGELFKIRCGTARVSCKVREIKQKLDSETGDVLEYNPKEISENEAGIIEYETESLVLEKFSEIPELGRFIIEKNKHIGAGVVISVE
jgi:elongation factor 1-alpha